MQEDKKHYTRVIIVEDDPLLAFTLEELLIDAGFKVVGVALKLNKALALIGSAMFDVAIVDVNLAGVSTSPAASALTARGIPFIVLSGYSLQQLPDEFLGARTMRKPCRPDQLIQALVEIAIKQ
jgi:DNA-binding response OmpR family regulator